MYVQGSLENKHVFLENMWVISCYHEMLHHRDRNTRLSWIHHLANCLCLSLVIMNEMMKMNFSYHFVQTTSDLQKMICEWTIDQLIWWHHTTACLLVMLCVRLFSVYGRIFLSPSRSVSRGEIWIWTLFIQYHSQSNHLHLDFNHQSTYIPNTLMNSNDSDPTIILAR